MGRVTPEDKDEPKKTQKNIVKENIKEVPKTKPSVDEDLEFAKKLQMQFVAQYEEDEKKKKLKLIQDQELALRMQNKIDQEKIIKEDEKLARQLQQKISSSYDSDEDNYNNNYNNHNLQNSTPRFYTYGYIQKNYEKQLEMQVMKERDQKNRERRAKKKARRLRNRRSKAARKKEEIKQKALRESQMRENEKKILTTTTTTGGINLIEEKGIVEEKKKVEKVQKNLVVEKEISWGEKKNASEIFCETECIVDTNALLDAKVEEIASLFFSLLISKTFIPFIVLEELDFNEKKNKTEMNGMYKRIKGITYLIEKAVDSKRSNVEIEKISTYVKSSSIGVRKSNDAIVLGVAVQKINSKSKKKKKVALVTNDRNLRVKAKAYNKDGLLVFHSIGALLRHVNKNARKKKKRK